MAHLIQKFLSIAVLVISIAVGMNLASRHVRAQQTRTSSVTAAEALIQERTALATPTPVPTPTKFVPSEVEVVTPPPMKHGEPHAIVTTTMGVIEIKLHSALAPQTVKNFVELARGEKDYTDSKTGRATRKPFYDGLTVHKVEKGHYVQMGCPIGTGRGGPGFVIPDEIVKELAFDQPGVVAMAPAREGVKQTKDSNGSQFFITVEAEPKWTGHFTIFGQVIQGMDIVKAIASVPAGPTDRPIRRIFIKSIEIKDDDSDPLAQPLVSQPAPASVNQ